MQLKNLWSNKHGEIFLRKPVTLPENIESAYVRIYVDTGYELFLNGYLVAAVDELCNTRDYDVKMFLTGGENLIAAHGINHGGHRGIAIELVVNGETVTVTDKSWKMAEDERWGWMLADYDDSDWEPAKELDLSAAGEPQWWTKPGTEPERIIPVLQCSQFFKGPIPKRCDSPFWTAKKQEFTPDKAVADLLGDDYVNRATTDHLPAIDKYSAIIDNTAEEKDGKLVISKTERYTGPSFIVDMGNETIGFFRMRIKSEKSVSFRLYYGETWDEAASEFSRDVLTNRMLREEFRMFGGEQEFESRMRVAFRYVRVEFFDCEAEVEASDFSVRTTLYPVQRRGYFSCDDANMTKLWEAGERTLHFCMQEYYLDAPKRDRLLWTGDARLCALINYHTFGDKELFEYSFRQIRAMQMPNGGVPSVLGEGSSMLWDYVAWYIISIYDYYMYTGNKDFVIENKDTIEKAAEYLTSLTNEDGVIDVPENPLGKMWMVELNTFVGVDPYLNKIYLRSLKSVRLAAELAGDMDCIKKYDALISKTEPEVEKLLADDALTKLFDTTEHTQLQFELAETDLVNGNISRMMQRIQRFWINMLTTGSDCLYECTLREEPYPRIDERHENRRPGFISYCHAWSAAATVFMTKGVVGITPLEPGFKTVQIKPQTDIYKNFACAMPTPMGDIAVKLSDGVLYYHLPEGMTAKLVIDGKEMTVTGDGQYAN